MFDPDTTAYKLVQSFMRFNRAEWNQRMSAGKKRSEMMMLFCIKRHAQEGEPAMRVSDISNHLRLTSPTVTQTLNVLENKGLVERFMDKEDRRAVRVQLTEEGFKTTDEGQKQFEEQINGLIQHLGEEDSLHLADLLKKVYEYYDIRSQQREQEKTHDDGDGVEEA